jgi:uncharacterized protein (TIRG00374 family)
MKPRTWISLVTLLLVALVVALGWGEITRALKVLGRVDLWILALVIPVQILSYWATGEVIFAYLRSKGGLKTAPWWLMPRVALELNFVHHIMPSAGVAGFSYLGWVLNRYGVSPGRATMAQIVQLALTFISYTFMLMIALVVLIFDHAVNRTIIGTSAALAIVIVGSVVLLIYATRDRDRLATLAGWVTRTANSVVSMLTRHRRTEVLELGTVQDFFQELNQDYCEIRDDRGLLVRPFLVSIAVNCLDISLLLIAFRSLGFWVNPAIVVIAFGLSSILGIVSATPGGTGVYETAMIVFMAAAGVPADTAIAGTLLARVVLLLGTVLFGYVFYQLTLNSYGKARPEPPGTSR